MTRAHNDDKNNNSDITPNLEVLNHDLDASLKLTDAFLGDISDREYLSRKENLITFLESPDLKIEGPNKVNLRNLQNFLQSVGNQNSAELDRLLTSLKEHFELHSDFSGLPADLIKTKILPKLVKKDQFSLARTNKRNLSIFADFLAQDMAPQLGLLVVQGNLDEAEKILLKTKLFKERVNQLLDVAFKEAWVMDYSKQYLVNLDEAERIFRETKPKRVNRPPNLALKNASVTDYSQRYFPAASALKLCRWIGDWYIEKILLMNLPEELKEEARAQIQAVKLTGIDYEYDLLLDGEVTQQMCDEQGAAVLDGRTPVILRGCEVVMLSFSEEENIDEAGEYLREISAKFDEQPILIKQGDKIYLYGFANKGSTENLGLEWCLNEMHHSGFSKLDFPKECKNPKRKYLALRKASEALTETMHAEIVKAHGEISYPYSFILMSIPEDQKQSEKDLPEKEPDDKDLAKKELAEKERAKKQFEKELTQIATENPNQPILVRQSESIFLYEFRNNEWSRTQLNDPGFKDLAFPKEGCCSLKLAPRKTNETLTQEMRHEMSTAHNFVDYRVQCREFVKTEQGTKTLARVQVLGERRFDYHPLKEALKDYIAIRRLWENADYPEGSLKEAAIHQWDRVVRIAQCFATAFLAQQYCHPKRSFEHVKFGEAEFRGKDRCLEFYDGAHEKSVFWFVRDSGLGSIFGIIRGDAERASQCSGWWARGRDADLDLRALETLCQVIFERLANIEQEYLDDPLVPSTSSNIPAASCEMQNK